MFARDPRALTSLYSGSSLDISKISTSKKSLRKR
jgi:hypothetical protein